MKPERWAQVGELYHAALELAPSQRAAFLDEACAGDEELRREIASLLAADESVGDFIAQPALQDAAQLLVTEQSLPAASLTAGQELGPYRINSLLGRGGMGEVYLAYDFRLERRVALKLLPLARTRDVAGVRRFAKEARALSALNHPNIVTIYDIGETEGQHYLVTEFIEGQSLRQRLAQDEMSLRTALDIIAQTAGALAAAHAADIVHRDIKPENIMVRPDGLVKVLDFGLAKLLARSAPRAEFATAAPSSSLFKTEPGTIIGTVAYMSPEQLRGEEVDARSDIFSLGVVCYELIAGHRPFTGATNSHVIVALLDQAPPPLTHYGQEAPAALAAIIVKALSTDREQRYQHVAELLADLKALPPTELTGVAAPTHARGSALTGGGEQWQPHQTAQLQPQMTGAEVNLSTSPALKDVGRLRRQLDFYRRSALIAFAAIISAAAAFFYFNRAPHLTERDTVLLADFVNQTGEELFDHTLRQALAVQLEQTPFLHFLPEERIRETLRYMQRAPDARVTKEVAREICQRQGVKALLVGSIARFDQRYALTLEAINSQTGEIIAGALAEAESKDRVLGALTVAATQLRARLGESLASIQKFAAPPEQATTSSLEAFQAWARGVEFGRTGRRVEAIPFYKLAKELDPNFARADVSLSLAYGTGGQLELAAAHAASAFALRDRVTERERFDIAGTYHTIATGDLVKAIEMYELLMQTYPRDYGPRVRLATVYRLVGEVEQSLTAARAAHQLNPRAYLPYVRMGAALVLLNRFDEAQAVFEQAVQLFPTSTARGDLYQLALLKGDAALMQQQIEALTGTADEYWVLHWQAQAASGAGQWRQAQDFYRRAATRAGPRHPERAAWFAEEALLRGAVCGLCRPVKTGAESALASTRITVQSYVPVAASRALSLALCGESGRAQALADQIQKNNPHSTLAQALWLPIVRAALALQRNQADQALALLAPLGGYEAVAFFWPNYLRGQAQLQRKDGAAAAREFQKILAHRGWDPTSPVAALAQLGLARAAALAGEAATSAQAYQAFLARWQDADADFPTLLAAKREFAALR